MARIALLLLALMSIGATPVKPFQRLVLSPGCYMLAPGGFYDVSAYCLDELAQAPAPGTILTGAPGALGETVIKSGSTVTSLQSAMQRGLIRLEGLGGGDYFHVRVRNLSAARIEICVTSPTIVLGDDGYPTADLKKAYPELARLLGQTGIAAPASGNEALETHVKLQKQIWDKLAELTPPADHPDDRDRPAPAQGKDHAVSDDEACAGPAGTTVICTDPKAAAHR